MRQDGVVDTPSFFVQLFFVQLEVWLGAGLTILSSRKLVRLASDRLDLLCILACRRIDSFRP
jgi:hypothetical protein